eukprot:126980-Prymnesium_polylepis.1
MPVDRESSASVNTTDFSKRPTLRDRTRGAPWLVLHPVESRMATVRLEESEPVASPGGWTMT